MMRLRWRTLSSGEVGTAIERLCAPIGGIDGRVRHMYVLSVLESSGPGSMRVATRGDAWAMAAVFPGRLLVPAGDPGLLRELGEPTRRWRLVVGDRPACDAVLTGTDLRRATVHDQLFMVVDRALVPDRATVADAGARRATRADVPRLAELAVQLHVEDRYGPDPGRAGLRGYAKRIGESVDRGLVWCVGPAGEPVAKLERSVSSRRWGVQLSGIVVDEAHRGHGLGGRLVAEAVRTAVSSPGQDGPVSLHVRSDNAAALRVYERAGFRVTEPWRVVVRP
jgi:ribosomal protein S18 acetylase RimI-like enzyme